MPRFARVLTPYFCLIAGLHAQQDAVLYTGSSAVERFAATDSTTKFVSADAEGITLTTAKGLVRVAGPYLTYQDAGGGWRPAKPKITSDNAGGWKQSGTPMEISLVGGGPIKHLKAGKGADSWDLTLEAVAHTKDNAFSFVAGGQTWRLLLLPYGTKMDATIVSRQGARSYSLPRRSTRRARARRWGS